MKTTWLPFLGLVFIAWFVSLSLSPILTLNALDDIGHQMHGAGKTEGSENIMAAVGKPQGNQ